MSDTQASAVKEVSASPGRQRDGFEYNPVAPRIVWGQGSAFRLEEELDRLNAPRVFIVCGRSVGASASFKSLRKRLGTRCVGVFAEVVPHTPRDNLAAAIAAARSANPDCIVTLGGGSVHDEGKLVALALAEGEDLDAFRVRWTDRRELFIPVPRQQKIPLIAIPTTLSAAEVVGAAAYVDGDSRYVIVDSGLLPKTMICDPTFAASTPRDVFLATGTNAIAHCVEAICSIRSQPISEGLAIGALRTLSKALLDYAEDAGDLGAVQRAQIGACMSGLAYTNTWLGIAHALCQALGARYRSAQGSLHAVILPHAMRFNFPATEEKQQLVSWSLESAVGQRLPSPRPSDPSVLMEQFFRGPLRLPKRLRDLAIPNAELDLVAQDAFVVWHTRFNPRKVESPEELRRILEEAW